MTGIWSLKILVITLLITPLTWIARIKELVLFRRMLGLFAFFYGSLHVVVYLWFYIGFDTALLLEDIFKRPYITIGFSAFVIMFLLAATSNRFAMKSLGKKWVKLHWGMYPLSLLVIWHYYWSVKINVFWPVLYGLIVLTLLACRFKIVKSYIKN
ncbi:MAG: protein-methionine-sulfoxide reductase heme-binding subunit MsrQ [Pseudomonadota bacterium]